MLLSSPTDANRDHGHWFVVVALVFLVTDLRLAEKVKFVGQPTKLQPHILSLYMVWTDLHPRPLVSLLIQLLLNDYLDLRLHWKLIILKKVDFLGPQYGVERKSVYNFFLLQLKILTISVLRALLLVVLDPELLLL